MTETPDPAAAAPNPVDLPPDSPWWARWMVANWREAWRWGSVRWPFLCALGCEIYAQYGEQIVAWIPPAWRPHIAAAVFVVGAILRLKRQIPKDVKP